MYDSVQSKYCYPGTNVLKNTVNFQNQDELDEFEKLVTTQRLIDCALTPIRGRFDLRHLCMIHRYIFQDVYPFAGKVREESISKGGFLFALPEHIHSQGAEIFGQLKAENQLKGLPRERFFERLAYYMSEINVLHPFREGNGRTQREFVRSLALPIWVQVGLE